MTGRVHAAWQSRSKRERLLVIITGILLLAVGASLILQTLVRERGALRSRVAELRADARQLEAHALELQRLREKQKPVASDRALRHALEAAARAAGVAHAITRVDAPGTNEAHVTIGRIEYAAWLAWVAALQSQNVRLAGCRLEALGVPGFVSATATFVRTP